VRVTKTAIPDLVLFEPKAHQDESCRQCLFEQAIGQRAALVHVALSERADVLYKATEYHASDLERCIRWDDPI